MPAFTIPGKPYGKKRPRFSRKSGRAFDPAENGKVEDSIGSIALPHFPEPLAGPVSIEIEARFMPAPSWSKKRRAAAIGQPHTAKPDTDNLAKAILDAMNRIAWADDGQVSSMTVRKVWADRDETLVVVMADGGAV